MKEIDDLKAGIARLSAEGQRRIHNAAQALRNTLNGFAPEVGEVALALVILEVAAKDEGEGDARNGQ